MNQALIDNLTPAEKLHYGVSLSGSDLEIFQKDVEKQTKAALDKQYESALEQSSFRADAIAEILAICKSAPNRYKETKELVSRIESYIENSYVEL